MAIPVIRLKIKQTYHQSNNMYNSKLEKFNFFGTIVYDYYCYCASDIGLIFARDRHISYHKLENVRNSSIYIDIT